MRTHVSPRWPSYGKWGRGGTLFLTPFSFEILVKYFFHFQVFRPCFQQIWFSDPVLNNSCLDFQVFCLCFQPNLFLYLGFCSVWFNNRSSLLPKKEKTIHLQRADNVLWHLFSFLMQNVRINLKKQVFCWLENALQGIWGLSRWALKGNAKLIRFQLRGNRVLKKEVIGYKRFPIWNMSIFRSENRHQRCMERRWYFHPLSSTTFALWC